VTPEDIDAHGACRPGSDREFRVATDMWSAGVSLFILLGGYPPSDADTTKAVFKRILLEEVRSSIIQGNTCEPPSGERESRVQ
jgi:serine/threonine protein kinase